MFGINTTNDISKLLHVISRAGRRVKFETILKYHEWYLCQVSRTNHAIISLYYFPQKVHEVLQFAMSYGSCSREAALEAESQLACYPNRKIMENNGKQ